MHRDIDTSQFHYVDKVPNLASWQLRPIMLSHGWINLPPFVRLPNGFLYSLLFENRKPVSLLIKTGRDGVLCFSDTWLSSGEKRNVMKCVERILSLDFPLHKFRAMCRRRNEGKLLHLSRRGWGRMLRSATPWEDAVKTLCTTNASWANTVRMCSGIVDGAGDTTPCGLRAFPSPRKLGRILSRSQDGAMSLGYRKEYLLALTREATFDGSAPLLTDVSTGSDELERRISLWKGFGPYATHHLMVLLGDHSYLPIDREVGKYIGVHLPGKRFKHKPITMYEDWGEFRFTAYKLLRVAARSNWIGDRLYQAKPNGPTIPRKRAIRPRTV